MRREKERTGAGAGADDDAIVALEETIDALEGSFEYYEEVSGLMGEMDRVNLSNVSLVSSYSLSQRATSREDEKRTHIVKPSISLASRSAVQRDSELLGDAKSRRKDRDSQDLKGALQGAIESAMAPAEARRDKADARLDKSFKYQLLQTQLDRRD